MSNRRPFVRQLADDRFKHIVQGDDAADPAELVHDQSDMNLILAEHFQQLGSRAVGRYGRWLGEQVLDRGGADEREISPEALHRNDAQRTIGRTSIDGKPRVARGHDLAPIDFVGVFKVKPDDAIARRHETLGRHQVQGQGAVHHAMLGSVKHAGSHSLVDHHAQLVLGHRVFGRTLASEEAQDDIGEESQRTDQRRGEERNRNHRP